MDSFQNSSDVEEKYHKGAVVIGNFDGVHRGHCHILAVAKNKFEPLVVVTFLPHPREILNSSAVPFRIASYAQKQRWLAQSGVDATVSIPFDKDFSKMSALDFVQNVLIPLNPRVIVVGQGFRFGAAREGDAALLSVLGFRVQEIAVMVETHNTESHESGVIVSSTALRQSLLEGDMDAFERLCGRPYELEGHPTKGDGIGKTIGFPTVNLLVEHGVMLPKKGIYAGYVRVKDHATLQQWRKAAIYVGDRPAFSKITSVTRWETHVLTPPDGAVFGQSNEHWSVRFSAYVRGDADGSIDDIKALIAKDVAFIEKTLPTLSTLA